MGIPLQLMVLLKRGVQKNVWGELIAIILTRQIFSKYRLKVKVQFLSCVVLFAILWTVAGQAPLSMGFSRQEYWSGLPCPPPRDLPEPGRFSRLNPGLQYCRWILYHLSHQGSPNIDYLHTHACMHALFRLLKLAANIQQYSLFRLRVWGWSQSLVRGELCHVIFFLSFFIEATMLQLSICRKKMTSLPLKKGTVKNMHWYILQLSFRINARTVTLTNESAAAAC